MGSNGKRISRKEFFHAAGAFGLSASFAGTASRLLASEDLDLIIRGATIHDGSGQSPVEGDVAVHRGRIVLVSRKIQKNARRVIDARGSILSPGFVDLHSHSDITLIQSPEAYSKIHQGVTTEVVGQDGRSVAPLNPDMFSRFASIYGIKPTWTDFEGYYRALYTSGISVNVMSMIGAGTLRQYVADHERRALTKGELQKARELYARAKKQGVGQLSSGLEYIPGSYATEYELARLSSVGSLYSTHMRSEDTHVIEALQEALRIAKGAGVRLNVSHMKAQGAPNHHKLPEMIELLDEARSSDFPVTCDRYPFEAYSSRLITLFPRWSRDRGEDGLIERFQNPHGDLQVRIGVEKKIQSIGSYDDVMLSSVRHPGYKKYQGMRLGEAAKQTGIEPYEFLKRLIEAKEGSSPMVVFAMSLENLKKVLAYRYCAIASDGAALRAQGNWKPHPRNFGTFPQVLGEFVRKQSVLSMEEAIRKMTSLPAQILGIKNRGLIRPGFYADLVMFDPEKISNRSTYSSPLHYPDGIEYVFVNGQAVIEGGDHTGHRPGHIIRV